ncbi:MAG TPA: acyl carrier protein [Chitinophagaceae bacterium]|nr:acyl carrier protein [Chitinophagaceae bacterium]
MKEKIRNFILSNLMVFDDDVELSDNDNIFQLGYVNSLFAMKLLTFVENEFGITVGNEDMDIRNFSSVNNIVRLVESKQVAGGVEN